MFTFCFSKKIIRYYAASIFILILFILSSTAFGQFVPFIPYNGLLFSSLANPLLNNFGNVSAINTWGNPYYNYFGFNPFSTYNNTAFNNTSLISRLFYPQVYPQASVAGTLIPFANPYINPLVSPYTLAANYFAAAVLPVDVSGSWAGQWISSFLAAGITAGELSITLVQNGTDVSGTAVFLLNKILKFGAYVVGTVEGNVLTLTSTIVTSITGTMSFDVTFIATVNDLTMEGTYEVINLVTGLIAEQGTFTATRL